MQIDDKMTDCGILIQWDTTQQGKKHIMDM